jgi:alanine racemase
MSLTSAVAFIKFVPAGESLGYGRTFVTRRDSMIATVPIGYHDGYRRGFSNRARVIVNGHYAAVVGRVSMDWTIIDITDVGGVSVGDNVILIGTSGELAVTAEELAAHIDTISYEITCGIGGRVPRRI